MNWTTTAPPLNVSREKQWATAAAACRNALGRVYILVCHAGINIMEALESTTLDVGRNTMNGNALGTFLGISTLLPLMKAQGGGGRKHPVCRIHGCVT